MRINTVLGYTALLLGSFFVCLYGYFPSEKLAAHVSQTFSAKHPQVNLQISTIHPDGLLKFKADAVQVLVNNTPYFQIERLDFSTDLFSLFKHHKNINVHAVVNQGHIYGSHKLADFDRLLFSDMNWTADGLKIKDAVYVTDLFKMTIDMVVNGQLDGSVDTNMKVSGKGRFQLDEIMIKIEDSNLNILGIKTIPFSSMDGDYFYQNNKVVFTECTAKGAVFSLTFNGQIWVKQPFKDSNLNINAVVMPDSAALPKLANITIVRKSVKYIDKNGLPFKITGPIKKPVVQL